MMIGTAGHIDHGKSTLVRALTGTDTDRLPEERRRGMSIELGYAFLPLPVAGRHAADPAQGAAVAEMPGAAPRGGGDATTAASNADVIAFIDVPGHEKLLHTMISGATGIDFGLLLVAADDGVMPQTREHLAVLSLLGISRGAVALTKIDRVDAARIDAVRAQIAALLAGTALAGAPIMPVSATTGSGVDALRQLLLREAQALHAAHTGAPDADASAAGEGVQHPEGNLAPGAQTPSDACTHERQAVGASLFNTRGFRLAVDRVFTLDGVGTVATGTVHAGSLRVGDVLDVLPDGPRGVRVRSLRAQNRETSEAVAGQRCAVGLAGIEKSALSRGQWLVQPGAADVTTRLDVELHLWQGEEKPLRSGTRVHLHLGTDSLMASVAVLGDASACVEPGKTGLVQLVLQTPLSACWGDRFILRDAAGSRVLAGGRVLDVHAPARHRASPGRLALLSALRAQQMPDALSGVLNTTDDGMNLLQWQRNFGLQGLASLAEWLGAHPHRRLSNTVIIAEAAWQSLQHRVITALQAFHETQTEELGPDQARLRRLAHLRMDDDAWRGALLQMQADGQLRLHGAFVHLPGHGEELAARDRVLMERVMPLLIEAGAQGVWVRDMAAHVDTPVEVLRGTMARLARSGHVHQVVRDLFLDQATTARLAALIRQLASGNAADGEGRQALNVAAFRDAAGLGRKRAVQVLEFFDRIGLCRRVGDSHLLRADSQLFLKADA